MTGCDDLSYTVTSTGPEGAIQMFLPYVNLVYGGVNAQTQIPGSKTSLQRMAGNGNGWPGYGLWPFDYGNPIPGFYN
ncbi:hypothetical protein, partial [Nocardia sp. NPDC051570]|uniref:hypothetical protein n=1 Tax=Nocardia sp. NPDC051570 TaxID=3364324 RepID=UPI00378EB18E